MKCPCGCGLDKPALSGWKSEHPKLRKECAGCHVFLGGSLDAEIVSHGLCDDCVRRLYPEYADEVLNGLKEKKS